MSDEEKPAPTDGGSAPPEVSPPDLGEWGSNYLDSLWDALHLYAETPEQFSGALAALVFHARHLRPEHHAELADLIRTPFKRPRGRSPNRSRQEEIWHRYFFLGPRTPRTQAIDEIAADYNLSHDAAEKAYDRAKRYFSGR
ncbi:hypothetical protein J5Y09_19975 [Roseomonas sp. PWR1]|uniref:Uncharacterized protein n=1 Tax=Roseomonas nitratireducens TaxID=2820810 RepID=A0ABS4AXW2_9PROT|nr:hypothetical protein [Neoroseomonas nitratireducens]MBP0466215.1 hypothetical protein [Neoroseomonas nitratireducens]